MRESELQAAMPVLSKRAILWSAIPEAIVLNIIFPLALALFQPRLGLSEVPSYWRVLSIVFFIPGFGLFLTALRTQLKSLKDVDRLDVAAPARLIKDGPYSISRNPMVLGAAVAWVGWGFAFWSILVLVGLVLLLAAMQLLVVPWEERNLEKRFGDEYRTYEMAVPRWIGRRRRSKLSQDTSS